MNTVATKFYRFHQNNTGGSFDHDEAKGIGPNVWIQAVDHLHANARAELIGIYFDGCRMGMDCPCCGDRWSEQWRDEGTETPENYRDVMRPAKPGEAPTLDWGYPMYIHYLDGTFKQAVKA